MAAVGRNLKIHVTKDRLGVAELRDAVIAAAERGQRGFAYFLAAPPRERRTVQEERDDRMYAQWAADARRIDGAAEAARLEIEAASSTVAPWDVIL